METKIKRPRGRPRKNPLPTLPSTIIEATTSLVADVKNDPNLDQSDDEPDPEDLRDQSDYEPEQEEELKEDDESDPTFVPETRKSKRKPKITFKIKDLFSKKANGRLNRSNDKNNDDEKVEDVKSEDDDDEEEIDSRKVSSSSRKQKRTVQKGYPKKHRYTTLKETCRLEWKKRVAKAYEQIISEDYLTYGFEDWILEPSSWRLLNESEPESYTNFYEEKSINFIYANTNKKATSLNLFEATTSEHYKFYDGCTVFCGAPIVACAWCPIPVAVDHPSAQCLALCTHKDHSLDSQNGPGRGCVQFWSMELKDKRPPRVELQFLLAHDFGLMLDVRWCPSGIYETVGESGSRDYHVTNHCNHVTDDKKRSATNHDRRWPERRFNRLGVLAATTGTGCIVLFGIPHVSQLLDDFRDQISLLGPRPNSNNNNLGKRPILPPVFKVRPLRILYSGTDQIGYCLDWSPFCQHSKIAGGFLDGSISVWNLHTKSELFLDDQNRFLPILSISVTNSPVRKIGWISDKLILVCGLERISSLWDIVERICLWTSRVQFSGLNFSCAPVFPGQVATFHGSIKYPNYPIYFDFLSGAAGTLIGLHSSFIQACHISPWHGTVLSADNLGTVCLSGLKFISEEKPIRQKCVEWVLHMSDIVEDLKHVKDMPNTYEEAKSCTTLRFPDCIIKVKKTHRSKPGVEDYYKDMEVKGRFPIAALFAAAWNPNKPYSPWCCFGGESGLLFIRLTDM